MGIFNNHKNICTLDIGSSKIAACAAQLCRKQVTNIWFEQIFSRGIRDGVIVDPSELVGCIGELMKSVKAQSGIAPRGIFTTIPGNEVIIRHSRAIIPLAEKGAKLITNQDIARVKQQARILGSSLDEEIMHSIPVSFTVDAKSSVINPLGLYGHKLEIDLLLVSGKTASIQNLDRVIHQAGYEIADVFFSGIATSRAVFNPAMHKDVTVLCDIGSDTTELMIFNNGVLRDVDVLSMGGNQLTFALRDNVKIPFELAEEIKMSYGAAGGVEHIAEDKEILVKKSNLYRPIKQRAVAEVVSAESQRMCMLIKDTLEKRIPCYEVGRCVIVGRTALLEGFIELLEQTLSIPVNLGAVENPYLISALKDRINLTGQNRVQYLGALGILCEALYGSSGIPQPDSLIPKNPLSSAVKVLRSVYQEYF